MKLELKSIKHAAFASQETDCFSAVIYRDGKRWAAIDNDGHGGPDRIAPACGRPYNDPAFWAEVEDVNAYLRTTDAGKAYEEPFHGITLKYDLEAWVSEQMNAHLIRKDMKRLLGRKVLFTKKGEAGLFKIGYKGGRKPDAALIASVRAKYPGAFILNDAPEADALAIYAAH